MDEMDKISAVLVHDGGTNYCAGITATPPMVQPFESIFAPVVDLDPELPFKVREVKGLSGGGSDHNSFLAANVPGFFWSQRGRANYNHTHHTQWDTFDAAIPEYQAHTATVIALTVLGVANLPSKLSRESLRAAGRGRGDATAMLEGFLGVQFEGMKVKTLEKDGVMEKASVQVGDVLQTVNGDKVANPTDVFRAARDAGFDTELGLGLDRGGETVKAKIKLEMENRGRRRRGGEEAAPASVPTPEVKPEVKKDSIIR
jgi:hypothetical protein